MWWQIFWWQAKGTVRPKWAVAPPITIQNMRFKLHQPTTLWCKHTYVRPRNTCYLLFFPIHISHVTVYLCILYISYHILHFPSEQPHCQWIIAWDISYKDVYPVQFMLQVLPRWKYQGGWNKISLRFLLSSRLLARHSLEESSHLRQLELKAQSWIIDQKPLLLLVLTRGKMRQEPRDHLRELAFAWNLFSTSPRIRWIL